MEQLLEHQEEITGRLEKVKYDVIRVAPNHLKMIWDRAYPLLRKSMTANPCLQMDEIIQGLSDGSMQFWMVARVDHRAVDAVFLTCIERDNGEWVLSLFNLGGANPKAWVNEVHEAMHQYARFEDCKRVRLCGRPAWQRILPGYPVVGERGGHLIYERVTECL